MELLNNFFIQTAILPLVVSGGIGFALRNTRFAGLGLLLGFVAAYLAIMGMPAFPPKASMQKLGWVIFFAFVAAFVLDIVKASAWRIYPGWVIAILGAAWMAWPRLKGFDPLWIGVFALVAVVTGIVLMQVNKANRQSLIAEGSILAMAIGVGGVSLIGSSASVGQLSFAMAAATGGIMLLNWPARRFAFGAVQLAALGTLTFLITAMVFYTHDVVWPMIFFGLIPLAGKFGETLALRRSLPMFATGIVSTIGCFVPAVITVGMTYFFTPVSKSLY